MSWSNYWHAPWMLFGRQYVTARQPNGRKAALGDLRSQTLLRVDREEREFHELMLHFRTAKDKVELNQLTA